MRINRQITAHDVNKRDSLGDDEVDYNGIPLYLYYGHNLSEKDIRNKFPYENQKFNRKKYSGKNMMLTYDVKTAYNLRKRSLPVLAWGQPLEDGRRAFVFLRDTNEV